MRDAWDAPNLLTRIWRENPRKSRLVGQAFWPVHLLQQSRALAPQVSHAIYLVEPPEAPEHSRVNRHRDQFRPARLALGVVRHHLTRARQQQPYIDRKSTRLGKECKSRVPTHH